MSFFNISLFCSINSKVNSSIFLAGSSHCEKVVPSPPVAALLSNMSATFATPQPTVATITLARIGALNFTAAVIWQVNFINSPSTYSETDQIPFNQSSMTTDVPLGSHSASDISSVQVVAVSNANTPLTTGTLIYDTRIRLTDGVIDGYSEPNV